jgi:ADP-heptose:LPS heptosyltransferase
MPKKKLLLIGYRAWGDWIYASPVIPILTEKYDVYFEINRKGYSLFHDDPRFKKIAVYTEFESQTRDKYEEMFKKRWDEMRELVKPDLEINLNGTCEVECIGETFQGPVLPAGRSERSAHYGADGILRRGV